MAVAISSLTDRWLTRQAGGSHFAYQCYATTLLTVLFLLAQPITSWAQAVDHEAPSLNPFFAAPIPSDSPIKDHTRNAVFFDVLQSKKEPTILLARAIDHISLLIGANPSGFGTIHPLSIHAGVHVAEGTGDTIWIGGVTGTSVTVQGAARSLAYLAKADRRGRFFWSREFGGQSKRSIQSIAGLQSGEVVVSGQDNEHTWLAKISADGNLLWERFVGLGKGSAVASIGDDIALIGLKSFPSEEASNFPPDPNYREDVVVWLFNSLGIALEHRVIRENINSNPSTWAANVQIWGSVESIYVSSAWTLPDRKPFELTKLDLHLRPIWRNRDQNSVRLPDHQQSLCFSPPTTALSNGDVLTSCQVKAGELALSHFNVANGDVSEMIVRIPRLPIYCDNDWPPARVFLREIGPRTIWILSSPADGIGANACGWIGQTNF